MTPGIAICALCGKPIERGQPFAEAVRGWSLPREAGGQNTVGRREVMPGIVAHVICVKTKRPGQGSLM